MDKLDTPGSALVPLFLKVAPQEIVFIKHILESYEELAVVRTLNADRGEIVALTGLVGAGRTETARLIFGADSREAGSITLDGEKLDIRSPRDAIAAGICLLTEDRKGQGLILNLSVLENFGLKVIEEYPYDIEHQSESFWIYNFTVDFPFNPDIEPENLRELLSDAFVAVWQNQADNDDFNQLI